MANFYYELSDSVTGIINLRRWCIFFQRQNGDFRKNYRFHFRAKPSITNNWPIASHDKCHLNKTFHGRIWPRVFGVSGVANLKTWNICPVFWSHVCSECRAHHCQVSLVHQFNITWVGKRSRLVLHFQSNILVIIGCIGLYIEGFNFICIFRNQIL